MIRFLLPRKIKKPILSKKSINQLPLWNISHPPPQFSSFMVSSPIRLLLPPLLNLKILNVLILQVSAHAIPSTGSTFTIPTLLHHRAFVSCLAHPFYTVHTSKKGTSRATRFDGSKKSLRINFCSTSIGFHSNLSQFFNWSLLAHHTKKKGKRKIVMRFTSLFVWKEIKRETARGVGVTEIIHKLHFPSSCYFILYHFQWNLNVKTFLRKCLITTWREEKRIKNG